jgi:hypothetical protein
MGREYRSASTQSMGGLGLNGYISIGWVGRNPERRVLVDNVTGGFSCAAWCGLSHFHLDHGELLDIRVLVACSDTAD